MGTRLSILALIFPLLAASPAVAAQKMKDVSKPVELAAEPGSPNEVLDDIAKGWMSKSADLILQHFGSNKVVIDVEGSGGDGSAYSKDQGHYVFKTLFRATVTRKFDFVQVRQSNDEGTSSFAIAERRYQVRDDGRMFRDKIYVALHLERSEHGERWVLDEIKSIR